MLPGLLQRAAVAAGVAGAARRALRQPQFQRRLAATPCRRCLFSTGGSGGGGGRAGASSAAPKGKTKADNRFLRGESSHDKGVLKMRKWDRRQIRNEREQRLRVALVGRPNVGKSTLFNRLTREKDAIIHDSPGTTRDWRIGQGVLGDLDFSVIDTGGLEEGPESSMQGQIVAQCERAVREANLVLFMMDARDGVVHMDEQFSNWLRRLSGSAGFHTQLVLNKTEAFRSEHRRDDFYDMKINASRLGLGDCIAISSAAGDGMAELYDVIRNAAAELGLDSGDDGSGSDNDNDNNSDDDDNFRIDPVATHVPVDDDSQDTDGGAGRAARAALREDQEPLQFAIIGKPNVGKSTLLNRLVITGAEPGVTRDAVCVQWEHEGRVVNIVDTAGIQRGTHGLKFQEDDVYIERKAYEAAMAALRYSHVALLLIDGRDGLVARTELSIAAEVLRQGRALVVAVNKCDDIPSFEAAQFGVEDTLAHQLAQGGALTVVPISALEGTNVDELLPALLHTFDQWRVRLSTHHLNDWLRAFTRLHGNPSHKRTTYRVKYITQVKSRPPTFTLFANKEEMPENYIRSLTRGLREEFDLHGVPVRVKTRVGANPFSDKKQRNSLKKKLTQGRKKKGQQYRRVPVEHLETQREARRAKAVAAAVAAAAEDE